MHTFPRNSKYVFYLDWLSSTNSIWARVWGVGVHRVTICDIISITVSNSIHEAANIIRVWNARVSEVSVCSLNQLNHWQSPNQHVLHVTWSAPQQSWQRSIAGPGTAGKSETTRWYERFQCSFMAVLPRRVVLPVLAKTHIISNWWHCLTL